MKNIDLINHCCSMEKYDYGDACKVCEYIHLCDEFVRKNVDTPGMHMDYIGNLTDEFLNADVNDPVRSWEDTVEVEMTESEYREYLEWRESLEHLAHKG